MNTIHECTILLIIVLGLLSIIIVCVFYRNTHLLKEAFFGSNHNCYPYTSDIPAKVSFKTKSKGWCTTADYGDTQRDGLSSDTGKSSMKCPDGHYRLKAPDSLQTGTKTWCKRPVN